MEPISLRSQTGWPSPQMPSGDQPALFQWEEWSLVTCQNQASQLQPIQQPPASCLVCCSCFFFFPYSVYLNVVYLALGTPLRLPIPSLRPSPLPARSSDSGVAELATVFYWAPDKCSLISRWSSTLAGIWGHQLASLAAFIYHSFGVPKTLSWLGKCSP